MNPIAKIGLQHRRKKWLLKVVWVNLTNFITEQKNTHMTHIEDKVLYGGVKGTRERINALRDMRYAGKSSSKYLLSGTVLPQSFVVKTQETSFVAKESLIKSKVYKTDAEIDADTTGDLADKLKLALKHLKPLGIKQVIQGTSCLQNKI